MMHYANGVTFQEAVIPLTVPGQVFSLTTYVCENCGAMVDPNNTWTHSEWHNSIQMLALQALQALVAEAITEPPPLGGRL